MAGDSGCPVAGGAQGCPVHPSAEQAGRCVSGLTHSQRRLLSSAALLGTFKKDFRTLSYWHLIFCCGVNTHVTF